MTIQAHVDHQWTDRWFKSHSNQLCFYCYRINKHSYIYKVHEFYFGSTTIHHSLPTRDLRLTRFQPSRVPRCPTVIPNAKHLADGGGLRISGCRSSPEEIWGAAEKQQCQKRSQKVIHAISHHTFTTGISDTTTWSYTQ